MCYKSSFYLLNALYQIIHVRPHLMRLFYRYTMHHIPPLLKSASVHHILCVNTSSDEDANCLSTVSTLSTVSIGCKGWWLMSWWYVFHMCTCWWSTWYCTRGWWLCTACECVADSKVVVLYKINGCRWLCTTYWLFAMMQMRFMRMYCVVLFTLYMVIPSSVVVVIPYWIPYWWWFRLPDDHAIHGDDDERHWLPSETCQRLDCFHDVN